MPDNGDPAEHAEPDDPFEATFEAVISSVSTLYRETGTIRHQLIGLDFRAGLVDVDAHVEVIWLPDRVPILIERMRRRWDMVAHVQFARGATDESGRSSIVAIGIYGADQFAFAHCVLDPVSRAITRGVLARRSGSASRLVL